MYERDRYALLLPALPGCYLDVWRPLLVDWVTVLYYRLHGPNAPGIVLQELQLTLSLHVLVPMAMQTAAMRLSVRPFAASCRTRHALALRPLPSVRRACRRSAVTQARRGNVEQAVESTQEKVEEGRHGHTSQSDAHIVSGTNASAVASEPQVGFCKILKGSTAPEGNAAFCDALRSNNPRFSTCCGEPGCARA